MKVIAKYTGQCDPDVLVKFYDEVSASATVDAMQAQGPPLPKVDVKSLFDNSLLKALEDEGFVDKLKPR